MKNPLLVLMAMFLSSTLAAAELRPEFRNVDLKENTMLNLEIMPDAGTQLIFPFALDNPDLTPTLKIRLTNPNGFTVPTDAAQVEALLKGQNTITIEGKANPNEPGAVYLGNLFITIGGYNISIALKSTYDTTKHVSNIIFNIDDATREHMIEAAVKRKTERLDHEYKEKVAALDEKAKEMSLSHVAIMAKRTPAATKYKADGRVNIDDFTVTVFADKLMQWDEKYYVLLFDLENRTSVDFTVQKLELVSVDGKAERTVNGSFDCDSRLNADATVQCSFASLSEAMKDAKRLKLRIDTDRGQGEFQW